MRCPECGFETIVYKRGVEALLELTVAHWRYASELGLADGENGYLVCPKTQRSVEPFIGEGVLYESRGERDTGADASAEGWPLMQ